MEAVPLPLPPPVPPVPDFLLTCDNLGRRIPSVKEIRHYLCVFGCDLAFWLLVLLRSRSKLHEVEKLAKLSTSVTIMYVCFLAPFIKLPLLVRFLVLFQASSSLALLFIWAFLSLKEWMNSLDAHTQQQQQSSSEPQVLVCCLGWHPKFCGGKVDEVGGSGSRHGSGASGRGENRGGYRSNCEGEAAVGGGDREASGSGHSSGARGSGENGGGEEGHKQDEGVTVREHGNGNGGEDRGGPGRGDGGDSGGPVEHDIERGVDGTNTKQACKSYSITEMSLMLTVQTTGTLIGFHFMPTQSSFYKALLVVGTMVQLVAYLCGLGSILLSSNKPKATDIFAIIGLICTALGFMLMVAMFVPWYFVLIAVLLFGVVLLIICWDQLKTRATEF